MQMPTYQTGHPIQPGDWVRVFSSQFGVWHHGVVRRLVFVPGGVAVEIIHNTKGGGVEIADWHQFGDGNPVFLHRRPKSPSHAADAVARADANVGKPYALFAQNCEHFASFAFAGIAESQSVRALGWMAAGVLTVAALTSDSR